MPHVNHTLEKVGGQLTLWTLWLRGPCCNNTNCFIISNPLPASPETMQMNSTSSHFAQRHICDIVQSDMMWSSFASFLAVIRQWLRTQFTFSFAGNSSFKILPNYGFTATFRHREIVMQTMTSVDWWLTIYKWRQRYIRLITGSTVPGSQPPLIHALSRKCWWATIKGTAV